MGAIMFKWIHTMLILSVTTNRSSKNSLLDKNYIIIAIPDLLYGDGQSIAYNISAMNMNKRWTYVML